MNRRAAALSATATAVVIVIAWQEHARFDAPPPPVPVHHVSADPGGRYGISFDPSYRIAAIAPGSPAAATDLRVGDVVTSVNGASISADTLAAAPPGTVVKLGLARGVIISITLGPPTAP